MIPATNETHGEKTISEEKCHARSDVSINNSKSEGVTTAAF